MNDFNLKIDIDDKLLKKFEKSLNETYKIDVGVLNGGDYIDKKGNITVAGYGYVNEFGNITRNIPERSFIRAPLLMGLGKEIEQNKIYIKNWLEIHHSSRKAFERIGFLAKRLIVEAFSNSFNGNWKPNKASTLKIKGKRSQRPLIDYGRLWRSIDFRLIEGKEALSE